MLSAFGLTVRMVGGYVSVVLAVELFTCAAPI